MEIEESKKLLLETQEQVKVLLNVFEKTTGLVVRSVDLTSEQVIGCGCFICYVDIDVGLYIDVGL